LSHIYDNVIRKKSLHVALKKSSHTAFKAACANRGLSMQEVIENFASKIYDQDAQILKFLDNVVVEKEDKFKSSFDKKQINDIYDILEDDKE